MKSKRRVKNAQPEKCVFLSCTNEALARDLCSGHYKQYMKGIPLKPLKKRAKAHALDNSECTIDGCSNKARSRNLCFKHYIAFKRILWKKKKDEERNHSN